MASSSRSGLTYPKSGEGTSSGKSALRGSPELQRKHQDSIHVPQDTRSFDVSYPSRASPLPYPLNLPPSYSVYQPFTPAKSSTRHQRSTAPLQSASSPADQRSISSSNSMERNTRVRDVQSASSFKSKGKITLDAFMDSRQASRPDESESSGSESDTPLGNIFTCPLPSDDRSFDSSAFESSSPPPSSPVKTPKENSPLCPAYMYSSSPTPKHLSQHSADLPFVLPSGPYTLHKPHWSLSALVGQALTASRSGSLTLKEIYTYISTVYPHFNRMNRSWMSSIRHNLSLQDAFERVSDDNNTRKGKNKPKGKGASWRIKPGHENCFLGGNFVKKGAKGAGPGLNQAKKRASEDDREHKRKRRKSEASTPYSPPGSPTRKLSRRHTYLDSPISSDASLQRWSSLPLLTTSQDTVSSGSSLSDSVPLLSSSPEPFEQDNEVLASAISSQFLVGNTQDRTLSLGSSLEPGIDISALQTSPQLSKGKGHDHANRDLFARVLASTTFAHALEESNSPSISSKQRLSSPLDSCASGNLLPVRRSLQNRDDLVQGNTKQEPEGAHINSVGSEGRLTPPPHEYRAQDDEMALTPKRPVFPRHPGTSPFRSPARWSSQRHRTGYDPYDPNILLADELASIRNANASQESPGGFFGKEGRRLLYESPSVPSRSQWRFRDDF